MNGARYHASVETDPSFGWSAVNGYEVMAKEVEAGMGERRGVSEESVSWQRSHQGQIGFYYPNACTAGKNEEHAELPVGSRV